MQHIAPHTLSWKVRIGILLPLLAMASMPLFVYFHFEHEHILLWMWLILIAVQMVLSLRTAGLAIGMMSGIRKHDGKHIQLTLTESEAKSFPRVVFMSVMRATWVDHVMLALPRLGIVLALMQYFHTSTIWSLWQSDIVSNMRPFFYFSYNYYDGAPPAPVIYPDGLQIFIALVILMVYAIFEGAFATVLAIIWAGFARKHTTLSFVFVSRIGMILLAISMFGFLNHPDLRTPHPFGDYVIRWHLNNCESLKFTEATDSISLARQQSGQELQASGECDALKVRLMKTRMIESTQVTMTSWIDQGILLSSNFMRPSVLQYLEYSDGDIIPHESYAPFVTRNILSALLAFVIYGVLIWSSLRIARNRLVRFCTHHS